jgi:CubicO group peptidase (beta-lactamase class C family)
MRPIPPRSRDRIISWCSALLLCQWLVLSAARAQHPADAVPRESDSPRLRALLDPLMEKAVADGNIPGGVLLVGHNGHVVYRGAFGSRSLEPTREPMTLDTIFDMASLTKCVATTTSIMKLVEEGRVRLNDPAAAYLPQFAQNGKQDITLRELLTHYSGLAPDLDLQAPWSGRDTAFAMAMAEEPINPPGSRFVYSDINFEVVGFIVEKVSGQSLADYAQKNVFTPLAMKHTRFLPPAEWRSRIAPTEYDEQHTMLRGTVKTCLADSRC